MCIRDRCRETRQTTIKVKEQQQNPPLFNNDWLNADIKFLCTKSVLLDATTTAARVFDEWTNASLRYIDHVLHHHGRLNITAATATETTILYVSHMSYLEV